MTPNPSPYLPPPAYPTGSTAVRERSQRQVCEAVCGSNRCEEGTPAVMLVGATCSRGHDLRRHLCQDCFDWIWQQPGQPGCSLCSYEGFQVTATMLEAVYV